MTAHTSIVVIGGGYAGVLAANRLQAHPDVTVTLINPRPEFVERIRLHQLAAGNDGAVAGFEQVLRPDIRLVVDTAVGIDAESARVQLASGGGLDYDYLVYAVGSSFTAPPSVPGVDEFACSVAEFEHARRLRARLQALPAAAPIVVAGAGLTGIETAAELAELGRPVTLIGDTLAPSLGEGARTAVGRRLGKLGVALCLGPEVRRVDGHGVSLSDGSRIPAAITVWTAGFAVPQLAAESGLATDRIGRLLTDETLTSIDDPHIVAAGDAATPSGLPLRMSCQAALPMGAQAAQTVLARIAGTEPALLSQAFTGQCISVGRRAGTIGVSHTDDSPRSVYIAGRPGAFVKERVCRLTVSALRREARKPGSYFWIKSTWRRDRLPDAEAVSLR